MGNPIPNPSTAIQNQIPNRIAGNPTNTGHPIHIGPNHIRRAIHNRHDIRRHLDIRNSYANTRVRRRNHRHGKRLIHVQH
jgi:hypothetical protein